MDLSIAMMLKFAVNGGKCQHNKGHPDCNSFTLCILKTEVHIFDAQYLVYFYVGISLNIHEFTICLTVK